MPFALIGVGLIMILTSVQNTHRQLGAQLAKDFTGTQSFTVWILAIGSVGALGYIDQLRTFSRYFLALILIAMVLSNKGFFQNFMQQFNAGPAAATVGPSLTQAPPGSTSTVQSGTPSFVQSFKQPGGGGFWNWIGIPSPF